MKNKLLYLLILLIGVIFPSILSSEFLIYSNPIKSPIIKSIPKNNKSSPRIKIPIIDIDSGIIGVGLTPKGNLDTPKNIRDIGLYDLGPIPGEIGNAIIVGHFGYIKGKGAIFNNLNKLKIGDYVYYLDKEGTMITFVVKKVKIYSINTPGDEIFISDDSKSHLNIITCQGSWDKSKKTYSNRLVIFTDKI